MNEVQILQFLLFALKLSPELAIITLSRLDFDAMKNMTRENAIEEMEYSECEHVLIEATAKKLNPLLEIAGIPITPFETQRLTEVMYSSAAEYPFDKVLSNYYELLTFGTSSEAFLKAVELSNQIIPF